MKITGRNIKRRLYGLRTLPSRIKRARYFRGHGVHSPFVYAIVRQVFMRSTFIGEQRALYDRLLASGVARRRALQLQNLMEHCGYNSFQIDECAETSTPCPLLIATLSTPPSRFDALATKAHEMGSTLCIISPAWDSERDKACRELVQAHPCTSVDNRGYLLLFNNHLPKQKFRL